MEQIDIQSQSSPTDAWKFLVRVGDTDLQTEHHVTITHDYWQELTGEKIPPEDLVRASFKFLLDREPKESILGKFNLSVIAQYFPEYPDTINSSFTSSQP